MGIDDIVKQTGKLVGTRRCEVTGVIEVFGEEAFGIEEVMILHTGILLLQFLGKTLDIGQCLGIDSVEICLIDGCVDQDETGATLLDSTGNRFVSLPQIIVNLFI